MPVGEPTDGTRSMSSKTSRLDLGAAVAANAEPADKMEQIRELMFGGTVRDFDRRMKELGDRLEAEQARLASTLESRINALETRIDTQLEKLTAQLRAESAARQTALDDLESRLNQSLRTQRNEINAVLQQHEDAAEAAEARARDALAQSDAKAASALQQLRDALANARTELGGEKLAREDLADLMAEVSLRLRGAQDVVKSGSKR